MKATSRVREFGWFQALMIFWLILLSAAFSLADTTLLTITNLSGGAGSTTPFEFTYPTGEFGLRINLSNPTEAPISVTFLKNEKDPESLRFEKIDEDTFEVFGFHPGKKKGAVYCGRSYSGLGLELIAFPIISDETLPSDLPKIMSANGWNNGSALMKRWLESEGGIEKKIITVDWVLKFPRIRKIYNGIFDDKIYINSPAQREINKTLRKASLGAFSTYCNFRAYDGRTYWNQSVYGFDDIDVALNKFSFHVYASGRIVAKDKKRIAVIEKVGVSLVDSFDFNGPQILGCWNKATNYGGSDPFKGTVFYNGTFREYRQIYGIGKDFKIKSAIKWTELKTPVVFVLK